MEIYKVYGAKRNLSIYVNNEKFAIETSSFDIYFDNKLAFGYGCDNYVVNFESDEEREMVDSSGIKTFSERRISYKLFKALQKLPGNGFLKSREYDAATKTILVSAEVF